MNWKNDLNAELVEKMEMIEEKIAPKRAEIQERALNNQMKVLEAFRHHNVNEGHFQYSSGYGFDDMGRDVLDAIYAEAFGAEAAIVRPQIISGTHAIATALMGVLRPSDELCYITGEPYDTLQEVIGITGDKVGSLADYNISYSQVDLLENGHPDLEGICRHLEQNQAIKVVGIQRSRGYALRPSLVMDEIKEMIDAVRSVRDDVIIFVDNCYGEFSEEVEPTEIGADLMAGSLIKNPGAGIVPTGGYIAGRKRYVEMSAIQLTAPGIGVEEGAMLSITPTMLQGFFMAPHMVSQAIQGAIFTAALLESYGMKADPIWSAPRTDLIQTVEFGNREDMVTFCQAIQHYSPINANVQPEPAAMPGYEDEIIMASGSFVQGATAELSCDGPVRPPYRLYIQGGLSYEHIKVAIAHAVNEIVYGKE